MRVLEYWHRETGLAAGGAVVAVTAFHHTPTVVLTSGLEAA